MSFLNIRFHYLTEEMDISTPTEGPVLFVQLTFRLPKAPLISHCRDNKGFVGKHRGPVWHTIYVHLSFLNFLGFSYPLAF